MTLPASDPTPDSDDSPEARKRWPRWITIAGVVAVVGAVVAIIAVLASGSDNGGTANTDGQSSSVNGSAAPTSASAEGATTAALSTTAPGTGSEPTTTLAVTVTTESAPPSTDSPTTAATGQPKRPDLGTAADFGVLGNTGVDSTGPTAITGQVGASNGSVTGFSASENPGVIVVDSPSAVQAQLAAQRVSLELDALAATPLPADVLAGQTIGPGVYGAATLGVTGTVTLDAGGDPNAVFVFQSTTTLTVSPGSQIVLAGGTQACNVFWRLGSSATFGTGSTFAGTVIAEQSITVSTGADMVGRLIALNGAASLDTDTIDVGTCT